MGFLTFLEALIMDAFESFNTVAVLPCLPCLRLRAAIISGDPGTLLQISFATSLVSNRRTNVRTASTASGCAKSSLEAPEPGRS